MQAQATKKDLTEFEERIDKRFSGFDKRFDNFEKRIDKRFDDVAMLMSQFANNVNGRFNTIEDRLDKHDQEFFSIHARLDKHDEEFRKLNAKYDHLVNIIDGFVSRIDKYETELAVRDHKIARLERWIEQIATKTGMKLDY